MLLMIISWIVFGFLVGLIARAIYPGSQPMGLLMTTVLGVIGSFVGGTVANLIAGNRVLDLHAAGFVGSLLGALLVLALASMSRRRTLTV